MTERIDLHGHLLPAIDDGCIDLDQSLHTARILLQHGYTTSVCTPHLWPDLFPGNTPDRIATWTARLQARLDEHNLALHLLPGGELRLFPAAIAWMKTHGVPTLGPSKAVLVDTWDSGFPRHAHRTLDWLLANGYQPVLAHPERSRMGEKFLRIVDRLVQRGVLLQGNLMPLAGRDLPGSEALAWQLLDAGAYAFLALDLHRPDTLADRLAGLQRVRHAHGDAFLNHLTARNPARLLADQPVESLPPTTPEPPHPD